MAYSSVREIGWTNQFGPLTNAELGNTLVPAFDHFTFANNELERLATVARGIKFCSIFQGA